MEKWSMDGLICKNSEALLMDSEIDFTTVHEIITITIEENLNPISLVLDNETPMKLQTQLLDETQLFKILVEKCNKVSNI